MLRRLFIVLSALSLLMCGATVALWVRSERTNDKWSKVHRSRRVQVKSDAGIVGLEAHPDMSVSGRTFRRLTIPRRRESHGREHRHGEATTTQGKRAVTATFEEAAA